MSGCRRPPSIARVLLVLAVVAFGLPAIPAAVSTQAAAQERVEHPWSLRDLLFPGRRKQRVDTRQYVDPPVSGKPRQASKPRRTDKVRRSDAPKKRPQKPAPSVVQVAKSADAKTILVAGDFVGGAIAEGLVAVFAGSPDVKVLDRTSASSGFVRDDHFDWVARISEFIEQDKPAAVVMLIGANDRQQLRLGGTRVAARSAEWNNEYAARTATFASVVTAAKVPLVWVGVPAFKAAKSTSDMLAFNETFRTAATSAGGEFIDVWDGFVDESGAFMATGPDVNGLPVRLRAGDGINFTSEGKRKLAFYAEKPLRKILGTAGVPDNTAPPAGLEAGPVNAYPTDRTPPIMITDPALDGGTELLGIAAAAVPAIAPLPSAQPAAVRVAPTPATSRPMFGAQPQPGRADDFSWPPNGSPDDGKTASTRAATVAPGSAADRP